ncbi:MAG: response regulator [Candidatus Nanopelagicales bacterium]
MGGIPDSVLSQSPLSSEPKQSKVSHLLALGLNGGMGQELASRRVAMIVEDDAAISVVLRTMLEDEGYQVLCAASAEQATVALAEQLPEIALVDLRLPGLQGIDLVRLIRQSSQIPIVIVTAQTDSHDVVACLEAGADDYITKPFVPKEVTARIRSILRRTAVSRESTSLPSSSRLQLDARTASAVIDGRVVAVTPIEYRVLEQLLAANGAVVSRNHLLHHVWGYEHAGDGRVVDNLIYRLRGKLQTSSALPEVIVTVRGFGYRLVM